MSKSYGKLVGSDLVVLDVRRTPYTSPTEDQIEDYATTHGYLELDYKRELQPTFEFGGINYPNWFYRTKWAVEGNKIVNQQWTAMNLIEAKNIASGQIQFKFQQLVEGTHYNVINYYAALGAPKLRLKYIYNPNLVGFPDTYVEHQLIELEEGGDVEVDATMAHHLNNINKEYRDSFYGYYYSVSQDVQKVDNVDDLFEIIVSYIYGTNPENQFPH